MKVVTRSRSPKAFTLIELPPPPVALSIPLNIQVSGGNLNLTRSDASFSLQAATNAAGLTTYTDTMTGRANFYRLMQP